jgi:hypothetical protein
MKMEAPYSSETLVFAYNITWCHNPVNKEKKIVNSNFGVVEVFCLHCPLFRWKK